ncbi:hypothetical protein LBMAG42_13540 [Deltaproteobacteria bacterium]|nr:hypothetical protein LBMAG42_13540 [Deltaproteobacteria bacterium]
MPFRSRFPRTFQRTLLLVPALVTALALIAVGAARYTSAVPCQAIVVTHDRDNCYSRRLVAMTGAETAEAAEVAEAIRDPLIRSASVVAWAKANRGQISADAATGVCRFAGEAAGKCRYQVQAGHLGAP